METKVSINKPFVSLFIAFLLAVSSLWIIPGSDKKVACLAKIRPFISYFGFWQSNTFFAPDIPKKNLDLRATIQCSDGKVLNYQFPRLENLSLLERIIKTPYRKYSYDFFKDDYYKDIRPDFARYLARKFAAPDCAPSVVAVDCFWYDVPPPSEGLKVDVGPHLKQSRLIEYKVLPEDLQ